MARFSGGMAIGAAVVWLGCARGASPTPSEPAATVAEDASAQTTELARPAQSSPRPDRSPSPDRSRLAPAPYRAQLRAASDACQQSYDVPCLCEALRRQRFEPSPDGGIRMLRWPLPSTPSGSTATDDGIQLVPLGPVFEVVIDGAGEVTSCGVTDPPHAAP